MSMIKYELSFELRDGCEDVQQELARRVRFIGIEALRGGYETNPEARQFLDAGDAVHKGATETIQFPDDDYVELPSPGIGHQLINPWARSFGPAHLVLVAPSKFPATALDVFLQFADLDSVGLIGCRHAGV